jgi:predicted nucleic acid-binding protein
VASLVDTNILVYRFDPRFPEKQRIAEEVLRRGIAEESLRVPHQAVIEFFSVVTRARRGETPLLPHKEALQETEDLLNLFPILYPTEAVLRTALRGAVAHGLSWFDAHLWAFAEVYELNELISEDFQHDRIYGTVRAVNPFIEL